MKTNFFKATSQSALALKISKLHFLPTLVTVMCEFHSIKHPCCYSNVSYTANNLDMSIYFAYLENDFEMPPESIQKHLLPLK